MEQWLKEQIMATIEKANAEQLSTILIFLREYIEGGQEHG